MTEADDDKSQRIVLGTDKYKVCGHFHPCTQRALKTCSRDTGCFILLVAYRTDTEAEGCAVVLSHIFC